MINQSTNNAEAPEDVQERATNETAVYFLIRLMYVLLFVNALILIGVGAILGYLAEVNAILEYLFEHGRISAYLNAEQLEEFKEEYKAWLTVKNKEAP